MAHQPPADVRVLFIGGEGRSGSTLLDRMLGQLPGFFSAGEIRDLWQSGVLLNSSCGCGLPFRSCPFWSEVGVEAFGGWQRADPSRVQALAEAVDRPSAVPSLAAGVFLPHQGRRFREYAKVLMSLYRAIHRVSGAVIVDSSKHPSSAFLLRRLAVDLRVVHLIRDSRGVAYSWGKTVPRTDAGAERGHMQRTGPARVSVRWMTRNLLMEAVASRVPSERVRYEDLIGRPGSVVARVARLAGTEPTEAELRFIRDDGVELATNHTVMGNPVRMQTGWIPLNVDTGWINDMKARDARIVTTLTAPLLRRYGYR